MKTLYLNINNEQIQSNEELEVLNYDLDSDFFFYLGEKIAKGCKVENENALITDFNTKDNEEDYKQIITQWNEIKTILFSEECEGKIEFTIPNGYIHWLRYSEKYNHVYHKNFSYGEPSVISIDLEELYEESVEEMQRKILRTLKRNDLYIGVDEIVFNDATISHTSMIINSIQKFYTTISVLSLNEWLEKKRLEKVRLENKKLERERLTRERLEQKRLERERQEQERLKQEQLEQERIERKKRLSGKFLSYNEYYIFRVVYSKIINDRYENSNTEERRFLLVKLREKIHKILKGEGFCINRFSPEIYTNPSSPFYGGCEPELSFNQNDFSRMSFFIKLCERSKSFGTDWFFDEEMLNEIYSIAMRYCNSKRDNIEIRIPYIENYNNNIISKIKWRSTLWNIHNFTYTYMRILKW